MEYSNTRKIVNIKKNAIYSGTPVYFFTNRIASNSGRDGHGKRILYTKTRSKSHIRKYRLVSFTRSNYDIPAKIVRIEHDPNRSANIALIMYLSGICCYVLHTHGVEVGNTIITYGDESLLSTRYKKGDSIFLKDAIPSTVIHNIEMVPGRGGVLARSAGTYGQVIKYHPILDKVSIRLRSGYIMRLPALCSASIGSVSNSLHRTVKLGKAGRHRWLGHKPCVRGVAMNPIDHPHGGGRGKKPAVPKTAWGKKLKWVKTSTKYKPKYND